MKLRFEVVILHRISKRKGKIMKLIENKKHFMHFTIAGFSFHEGCDVFDQLNIGTPLRLIREDENTHDPNAVAIFFGDTMLGYVPRQRNEQLAMLFDMGYEDIFEAKVQSLDPTANPEEQVGVIILIKRAKRTKK